MAATLARLAGHLGLGYGLKVVHQVHHQGGSVAPGTTRAAIAGGGELVNQGSRCWGGVASA